MSAFIYLIMILKKYHSNLNYKLSTVHIHGVKHACNSWFTGGNFMVVQWLILKEINPEYSLEGLMLKPKLQYFAHLMWRADSLEKTLMLGTIKGRRRRRQQRMRWLDDITDSMDMNLSKLWGIVKDKRGWRAAVHRISKSLTPYSDWTATTL